MKPDYIKVLIHDDNEGLSPITAYLNTSRVTLLYEINSRVYVEIQEHPANVILEIPEITINDAFHQLSGAFLNE